MIQVDVFWSFAMGASFAASGASGIKLTKSMFVNKYFVYTVCYLSLIFAPSGIYLLWQHTGWETMFFYDRSLHGIWPCLFAHTNISLGILGFMAAYKCVRSGHEKLAHTLWVVAYTCMFSILSFGYDRFLYAGTGHDWKTRIAHRLVDFFYSEVFHALLVMSLFVLPPIYYAMTMWPAEYGITTEGKLSNLRHVMTKYSQLTIFVGLVYVILLYTGQLPQSFGLDRLLAFLLGQLIFGSLTVVPLLLVRTTKRRKKMQ